MNKQLDISRPPSECENEEILAHPNFEKQHLISDKNGDDLSVQSEINLNPRDAERIAGKVSRFM